MKPVQVFEGKGTPMVRVPLDLLIKNISAWIGHPGPGYVQIDEDDREWMEAAALAFHEDSLFPFDTDLVQVVHGKFWSMLWDIKKQILNPDADPND